MPANGAVYIQKEEKINLADVFDEVSSNKGLFRKASYYDVVLNGETVRFNVMDPSALQNHINGFLSYINSLDHDQTRKEDTIYSISHTKTVLGLVASSEFEDNHAIWESLFKIAEKYDGFVFVNNSVLLPNGGVLVGPMLETST